MTDLSTLNNALFAQLTKLENATGDELKREMERAKVITDVGKTIIQNGQLVMEAQKYQNEYTAVKPSGLPKLLTGQDNEG